MQAFLAGLAGSTSGLSRLTAPCPTEPKGDKPPQRNSFIDVDRQTLAPLKQPLGDRALFYVAPVDSSRPPEPNLFVPGLGAPVSFHKA